MNEIKTQIYAIAIVNSKELLASLKFVKHSLVKSSSDTNSCFFLEFKPEILIIAANDMRSSVRTVLEVDNPVELCSGNIYLGLDLVSFLGVCELQPLKMELCGTLTSIKDAVRKYIKITTATGVFEFDSPFPSINENLIKLFNERKAICEITADDLKIGLEFASAAKKPNNIDEVIKGNVCLKIANNRVSITATDGFRIHKFSSKLESESNAGSYLIDGKALELVGHFLKRNSLDIINISSSENSIVIKSKDDEISLRMYDSKFPDTDGIINKASGGGFFVNIMIEVDRLKAVLSRVGVFAGQYSKCLIDINAAEGIMTIGDENGKSSEVMEIEALSVESDLKIKLNLDHLVDMCGKMATENVRMVGKDSTTFVLFDNSVFDQRCEALLMPFS